MMCPPQKPIAAPEWGAFLASLQAHEVYRVAMLYAALQATTGPVQ